MCSPALCQTCGKTTWAGCGDHAAMVMASIPAEARCACHEVPAPPQAADNAFGW